MSETLPTLRRKIQSAKELHSVVRTMKAMAASSINQYENAVVALRDYERTIELGLIAYFRQFRLPPVPLKPSNRQTSHIGLVLFGSDQGLVGQFNDVLISFLHSHFADLGSSSMVWPVGDRMLAALNDSDFRVGKSFALPKILDSVTPLVAEILIEVEYQRRQGNIDQIFLVYNSPLSMADYTAVCHRLLPLDSSWQLGLTKQPWPTQKLPQLLNQHKASLAALINEYLFGSLYKACVESLASENASRLFAMQRAQKNIEDLQETLSGAFHQQRQSAIDNELFDLICGFEALQGATQKRN